MKDKEESLDLFYLNSQLEKETQERLNNKKKRADKSSAPKDKKSKKKLLMLCRKMKDEDIEQEENKKDDDIFCFDNEIVIGVTKIPEPKNEKKKKLPNNKPKKKNNKKLQNKKSKQKPKQPQRKLTEEEKQILRKKRARSKFIGMIIKWTFLIVSLIIAIIYFMLSPIFNISEIKVTGNEKITENQIISLSGIQLGDNIYKTNKKEVVNKIKQNSYIENIEFKRSLPNKIELNVEERKATYMLEFSNSYVYINNQGYILEISQEKIDGQIIIGFATETDQIHEGNRLCNEDLEKLDMVLKIMDSANRNNVSTLITKIDISDKSDYKLILESENKIAHLGDASNISTRILYLKSIIEHEKGKTGELFINGDLNNDKVFFREKV